MGKRRLQVLFAAFVALVAMVFAATPAHAANATNLSTATISVSGAESSTVTSIYQVITVKWEPGQASPEGYYWSTVGGSNKNVLSWVQDEYPSYVGPGGKVSDEFTQSLTSTQKETFFKKLGDAIRNRLVILSPNEQLTGNKTTGKLLMGSYLLLSTSSTSYNYKEAVVNLVPVLDEGQWTIQNNYDVTLKREPITIDKKFDDSTGREDKDTNQYQVGDVVPYVIDSQIPQWAEGSTNRELYVGDTMCDGLTLDTSSIKVYGVSSGGRKTLLSAGTDYTVNTTDAKHPESSAPMTFLITFTKTFLDKQQYPSISVTYSATVNENAVVGELGNENDARIVWRDPDRNWRENTDKVKVYTYGIDVSKVDGNKQPLAGAEFYLTDEDGTEIQFIKIGDGQYRVAKASEGGANKTLVVSSQGKLDLKGLAAGTYTLYESKTPEGYNPISPMEVVIKATESAGEYTGHVQGEQSGKIGYVPVEVVNNKGFVLPTTGGMGTALFTAAGVVVIACGVGALYALRKRDDRA